MVSFEYNDKDYKVNIIRKNNKNTYIRVDDNLDVVVTTNYLVSDRSINKLLIENKDSVIRMINKKQNKNEKQKEIDDNNIILFGKRYNIVYGELFKDIEINNNTIFVSDKKSLNKYLNKEITNTYKQYLDKWINIFEEKLPKVNLKIRKMKSRWGVCNRKNNNVTLNLELINYDFACLDYVIVHELSHFIVPNHSHEFWKVVEKYYPNYKKIRKTLRS